MNRTTTLRRTTGSGAMTPPFGTIGIVICFDRHLPDGIRSCATQGAELVLRTGGKQVVKWAVEGAGRQAGNLQRVGMRQLPGI